MQNFSNQHPYTDHEFTKTEAEIKKQSTGRGIFVQSAKFVERHKKSVNKEIMCYSVRAGFVMANAASDASQSELEIRKRIIEDGYEVV